MRALITGIGGQDGSYLAELLLAKGYEVHGLARQSDVLDNLSSVQTEVAVHRVPDEGPNDYAKLLPELRPDEVYHLGAPSFVAVDPAEEQVNFRAIVLDCQALMSAAATSLPQARILLAGTSEMFGRPDVAPQTEATPFRPRSVYGLAKLCAHETMRFYRDNRGLFACTGIFYNHESPRRPPRFVTRKITRAAARIARGLDSELRLGDLAAQRDWGYAPDFVDAMWRTLQADVPDDYIVATGELRSVGELVAHAFERVGVDPDNYVVVDPAFVRPPEPVPLLGDPAKLREATGWQPRHSFKEMIDEMVDRDLALLDSNGLAEEDAK